MCAQTLVVIADESFKVITCSCSEDCEGRCSCKNAGLMCAYCSGLSCSNFTQRVVEDPDNDTIKMLNTGLHFFNSSDEYTVYTLTSNKQLLD